MKPTILEVNKKLAEYEGLDYRGQAANPRYIRIGSTGSILSFTESLDAQIPIMEKLVKLKISFSITYRDKHVLIKVFKQRKYIFEFEDAERDYPLLQAYALYYAIERSKEK